MITMLTIDEIIEFLAKTPEQAVFDWKSDFTLPNDDEKRGELIKDIAAIANAAALSHGFIFYGVDPRKPDPIVGISQNYDDSKIQQLVKGKIEPFPSFIYYEVSRGPKTVSVIQVAPDRRRPFIITTDLGKIRSGQIVIRRGSSTDGIKQNDLFEFFYGNTSGYFPGVVHRLGIDIQQQVAQTNHLALLQQLANKAEQDLRESLGF